MEKTYEKCNLNTTTNANLLITPKRINATFHSPAMISFLVMLKLYWKSIYDNCQYFYPKRFGFKSTGNYSNNFTPKGHTQLQVNLQCLN